MPLFPGQFLVLELRCIRCLAFFLAFHLEGWEMGWEGGLGLGVGLGSGSAATELFCLTMRGPRSNAAASRSHERRSRLHPSQDYGHHQSNFENAQNMASQHSEMKAMFAEWQNCNHEDQPSLRKDPEMDNRETIFSITSALQTGWAIWNCCNHRQPSTAILCIRSSTTHSCRMSEERIA